MKKSLLLGVLTAGLTVAMAIPAFAGTKIRLDSGTYDLKSLKSARVRTSGAAVMPSRSAYNIVQFERALTAKEQNQLTALGVEILRYVPDDAYVVRASQGAMIALRASTLPLRETLPYEPQFRVSSVLGVRSVFNRAEMKELNAAVFPGVSAKVVAGELAARGAQVLETSERMILVRVPMAQVEAIAATEGVEWVSERTRHQMRMLPRFQSANLEAEPHFLGDYSDLTGQESGTYVMNFSRAWSSGISGSSELVVAADTGLDTGDRSTMATDFSNTTLTEIFGYMSTTWGDPVGHGTHVLGSVGSNGSLSGNRVTGGATRAQVGMQSVWSAKYQSLTVPNDVRELFTSAYNKGARVHTNSWGDGDPKNQGRYDNESSLVDQFVWDHPDMVILFAAGNDGVDANRDGRIDPGSVSPPATSKNVISVGASENYVMKGGMQGTAGQYSPENWGSGPLANDRFSDNPNGLALFSSRGPTRDGRLKPDVVAPGSNILSNCSQTEGASEMWGRYNQRHCFSGGTSMATPLVAGAAAVVRERLRAIPSVGNPSAALVKGVLMHTAVDLYPGQFGEIGLAAGQELAAPGPNNDQGYGRVDVGRAVSSRLMFNDDEVGLGTGETASWELDSVSKVTLVYTDAPATPGAQATLVNDLDLEVTSTSGTYSSESRVDNSEQVRIEDGAAGPFTVTVKATRVAMGKNGKQPYAIVISR